MRVVLLLIVVSILSSAVVRMRVHILVRSVGSLGGLLLLLLLNLLILIIILKLRILNCLRATIGSTTHLLLSWYLSLGLQLLIVLHHLDELAFI